MGREFELKFQAGEAQLEAIRRQYGNFQEIAMETVYYDTPGGILRQLHWTLRRRMENGNPICTLKTDLPQGGRGEWEVACGQIMDAVPLLIAQGAPEALAEYTAPGVTAICGARFTRLAARVSAGQGQVELALDRGELLGGGKALPFAEVEVELKEGTDQDAILFAQALAQQHGLLPERKSKLRRALSL